MDGFDIVFYINNSIYYKDDSFICSPRCIFISRNNVYNPIDMKFDALRFSGGITNRFYINRNMIEFDSVSKAVDDRDDIAHNNTVKLSGISIGIYQMILKLNYVMILDYIGVPVEIYSKRIQHLGLVNII